MAIFVRNTQTREGFAIVNEVPGYLKRTDVGEGWREGVSVRYGTDLFPFERTLQPGKSFQSAKSSLVFFKDGNGFADSHWAVPSYMSAVVMRRGERFQPLWLYNTWEPFRTKIDQATVEQSIPVAARMGIDVLTIDDGWQVAYGSTEEDRRKFPDSVSSLNETLQRNKMGLGLWAPLAIISTDSEEYRDHPEWVCCGRGGQPKFAETGSGKQAVMCLGTEYRDVALRRLSDLVAMYGLHYLKVDLTALFDMQGEAPGCHAPGHLHQNWAESLGLIYEALQFIGERLHEQHPDVLVDYTYELWGEKHLVDAALLGCADLSWLSNVRDAEPVDAGPLQARTLLYQRALSIPSECMLIGNMQAASGPVEERFGVAIGSGPVLLGDLRKLTLAQQDWYGEMTRWYKELRSRSSLLDSFFPLGSWRQPRLDQWDGFARLSRNGDGIVVLFRNASEVSRVEIKIVAPPDAGYEARSVLDGRALGRVTAGDFGAGWSVSLDREHAVTIVELRRLFPAEGNGGIDLRSSPSGEN